MFLVYLINLINVGPTLNLRGEVVLNLQPVNGVSKVKVVGLPNHYQTDNRGFFNFSIKDEKQEQITLRAEYNNWIGSKIFSRGNLLSIELPLTSEILEELIKPDFGNQRTAFFSGYSFGESAYYDKKAGGGAFTYSFIKNIQQDMSLNIGGLFEQIDTEMRLRIKNMRSPRLWVSDKKLPEEKLFNVEDESGKQTLALVIGISRYMDNRIPSLKYSVSDAMRVQEFFLNNFKPSQVRMLSNDFATRKQVSSMLHSLAKSHESIFQVFIYLSGHFYREDEEIYFLLYDSTLNSIKPNSLSLSELYSILSTIKVNRLVLLIDG